MNKEKIKRIIETANVQTVAEAIGIKMQYSFGKTAILCPGHEKHVGHKDRSFGSCYLTQHGYYCFAHHHATNVIEMVQEQSELNGNPFTWNEAVTFVAQICGLEDYLADDCNEVQLTWKDPFPLNNEEMTAIGLTEYPRQDTIYTGFCTQTEGDIYHLYRKINDGNNVSLQSCHLQTDKSSSYSWNSFYADNKQLCLEILLENSNDAYSKAVITYQNLTQKPYLFNKFQIQMDYMVLLNKLKNRIKEIEKVIQKLNRLNTCSPEGNEYVNY